MALRTDGGRHMKPELSGSATNLWKRQHRKMKILQPLRTKESLTARWQQKHLHKQRQMKRSVPTSRWARGNCQDTKFADENWSKSLLSLQQQSAEPPVRCGRKSDSIMLVGFGSLLTKILFSYRSTEVYGILIVMKIPAERSRSWGLRSNPWLLIGEVREVFYTSTLILGACTSEHLGDSIVLTLMGKLNMIFVLIW